MSQTHANSEPHSEPNLRPKLMLIDGNSITYRAFFALPPLSNSQGQFTNAVYGFTQMLLKVLQTEHPTHVAVAFDAGKQTFRHRVYDEYKGTRQKTPSELSEQFPLVREVLEAFEIPALEVPEYEADDIIGTLATNAEAKGYEVLVVSGDKDLLQLVTNQVNAILTRKGVTDVERYTPESVFERYELTPRQIIDLKGLMGDNSDNIPGVPGVGEKTAIKLLKEFGSVEAVLSHIDDVSGNKLKERLRENEDKALMSKQLATIFCEVPINVAVDALTYSGQLTPKVLTVFRKLGFKSLVDKISREIDFSTNPSTVVDGKGGETKGVDEDTASATQETGVSSGDGTLTTKPAPQTPYQLIATKMELEQLWRQLRGEVGVIPVCDGADYHTANLEGFAIGTKSACYYVSFDGELETTDVKPLWSKDFEKTVFDLKSLVVLLDAHGQTLTPDGHWFDVLVSSYLLNPSDGELTLQNLLERELHRNVPQCNWDAVGDVEKKSQVASWLLELKHHINAGLREQELDDLFYKVELPLEFVLANMEVLGFRVNSERLKGIGGELQKQLEHLTEQIYQHAGMEFNINSPKQLGEVLFEKLGLPAMKKTKTGYSTSADVLEKLAPYHDIVADILQFRQLGKLQSTYVEGLLKVIRPETDRVHTRFHQALTATGRLSSSEPNLQNIPIRMEEGRKLRLAFEPTYQDWVILSADYSQVELRILAHLSGDEALVQAFRNDEDIHTSTAATVFGVAPEEVTSLMRRQAKAVNFGIVYGISDYGLSQNLNITRAEAARFIEDYFSKFPGVANYMKEIVEGARKTGYVTTLLNRRRYLPDIHSRNFNLRSFAERTAMNTPIQGTAADIIKLAMVRIDQALRESDLQARMLLQVHDELIFECPQTEVEELEALVHEKMENALTLSVPLKVDVHVGRTWYEAK
ncbi:DNA polymerase I [Alicyclobacillus mengziensis]|uniref:DNA polymerase I n=1 Tax=Alicyclobacillus mengziensis TaxID=2931921 RepID=A0A9X7VXM1_9BACL|nr:DNA polymerase I [Alicyclobacillus mengziensis]QSO46762.1 DNA polymerase I [Alicyclobacillus mengziensis]